VVPRRVCDLGGGMQGVPPVSTNPDIYLETEENPGKLQWQRKVLGTAPCVDLATFLRAASTPTDFHSPLATAAGIFGRLNCLPSCQADGFPVLGRGYIAARTDTTQQSGQTPDKEVEIKNITVYVSGNTEGPDSRGR